MKKIKIGTAKRIIRLSEGNDVIFRDETPELETKDPLSPPQSRRPWSRGVCGGDAGGSIPVWCVPCCGNASIEWRVVRADEAGNCGKGPCGKTEAAGACRRR